MNYTEMVAAIESALDRSRIPKDRAWVKPWTSIQDYRGKRQRVVGYSWSKPYSSLSSGRVYDCVLGWGDTFDEALAKMRERHTDRESAGA